MASHPMDERMTVSSESQQEAESLIMWQTSITRADLISKTITMRKMKAIDMEKFSDNLDFNHIVEMSDIDNILDGINNMIIEALDKHAPLLTETITVRHKQPWLQMM